MVARGTLSYAQRLTALGGENARGLPPAQDMADNGTAHARKTRRVINHLGRDDVRRIAHGRSPLRAQIGELLRAGVVVALVVSAVVAAAVG